jgi:putative flavoprotein involved in K+ transport
MSERHETVIVGGGQAGLAMSHHLTRRGRPHVILERGRVGERWRSERWDSLMFQFPNWSLRLPGQDYEGGDPDGFASREEVIAFIERYREAIQAPVRTGVRVISLTASDDHDTLCLDTTQGPLEAANVVIATGPYQEPAVPAVSQALPPHVAQVHSSRYRNPDQLPAGAVLVVGSGASGCQIVEDLLAAGRIVYLSLGRHRRFPRRYRGRDMFWWLERLGALDQTLEEHPEARERPNPLVTGVGGGHDIDLRHYRDDGAILLGRLRGITGSRLHLAGDVEALLAAGDESVAAFIRSVDAHIVMSGIEAPAEPTPAPPPHEAEPAIRELDLEAAGISVVIWATGFRRDFGWIRLPVLDDRGEPVHCRGVTRRAGVYFLGLPWLHTLRSSVLCGVGDDAAYLAEQIVSRVAAPAARRA